MPADTPKSRTLQLKKNNLIVYKQPKNMTDKDFGDFLTKAANQVLATFGISTIVVGVEEWQEVRILDEHEMEREGWIRKERVFLLKEDLDLTKFTTEELGEVAGWMSDSLEKWHAEEEE